MTDAMTARTWFLDAEFMEGYRDGGNLSSPEPGPNRTDAYRHSFEVRRAELAGNPIPAAVSRARAAAIESAELNATIN